LRGRKPKATILKLITGNPGGRPLNMDEPKPEGDLVSPPDWFTPRQRILWDQIIRDAPEGLLRKLDSTMLETFIVAKSLHEEASQKIAQVGTLIKETRTGRPIRNPFLMVLNQQAQVMCKCIAEMGFSPSSRTRVVVKRKSSKSAFSKLRELKLN
jgi:P27 family predicted phage terminase small subunit